MNLLKPLNQIMRKRTAYFILNIGIIGGAPLTNWVNGSTIDVHEFFLALVPVMVIMNIAAYISSLNYKDWSW